MRHRKRTFKIGRRPAHTRSLLANQVCSLIQEKRIQTTVVKAKEVRRLAERMVTLAKKGTLHHRRRAISIIKDLPSVRILFDEIADNYREREGGYTRIIRTGTRRGDAAEMCYLEFVEAGAPAGASKKRRKKAAKPTAAAAEAAEAAAEEEADVAVAEADAEADAETEDKAE